MIRTLPLLLQAMNSTFGSKNPHLHKCAASFKDWTAFSSGTGGGMSRKQQDGGSISGTELFALKCLARHYAGSLSASLAL